MDIDISQSLFVEIFWAQDEIWQHGCEAHLQAVTLPWVGLWQVHQGAACWQYGDREWHVQAGDVLLYPMEQPRTITCIEPVVVTTLGFYARLFGCANLLSTLDLPRIWQPSAGEWHTLRLLTSLLIYAQQPLVCVEPPAHRMIETSFHIHAKMAKAPGCTPNEIMRDGIGRALVGLCWRMLSADGLPVTGRPEMPSWLAHTLCLVRRRPDITTLQLAQETGYSLPHFRRLFQRCMHMPPHAYLQQYRLTIAKQLLQTTDLMVSEIARQLGFASTSDFTRFFRHQYASTPTDFRKAMTRRTGDDQ